MKRHSKVNLWATHTLTTLSITLVLFMLGFLLLLEYHSYRMTHNMQERITYKVEMMPDVSDSTAAVLKAEIEAKPYVKHVDYISKEEAANIFTEELGDDFVGFIGYNPLFPSMMVNFKSGLLPDKSKKVQEQFTAEFGTKECVTGVAYQTNVVDELNDVFYKVGWFLIIFIALLLIICIILISSTISISLYAQRDTIKTMRLVGAKTSSIIRPFMWKGIWYSILGGVIADILMVIALFILQNQFSLELLTEAHYMWYGIIMVSVILIGLLITWIATQFAVRKYLKEN